MTFPLLTFIKFTNAQYRYVQIPYTEFPTNRAVNVGSTGRESCTPLGKVWLSAVIFIHLVITHSIFVGTSCTELFP